MVDGVLVGKVRRLSGAIHATVAAYRYYPAVLLGDSDTTQDETGEMETAGSDVSGANEPWASKDSAT